MAQVKTTVCTKGHNKDIVGRNSCGNCIECHSLKAKVYRKRYPESDRKRILKRDYGIDLNQYNKLFQAQKGLCLGCYKHQTQFTEHLAVDHDHQTGKIRGLLCRTCNLTLGTAHDNVVILRRLADYIEHSSRLVNF